MEINLTKDQALKTYHTFGLPVKASYFAPVSSLEELSTLIHSDVWQENEQCILGEGSNTLFVDDFNGVVLQNRLRGIILENETKDSVTLRIASGENWHQLVNYCIEHEYYGIENLSLIPGSVGAAPVQNIGAYGVELTDVFESLDAVDVKTGQARTFSQADCEFAYRDSIFKRDLKGQFIITSVVLKLQKAPNFNTSYGVLQEQLDSMGEKMLSLRTMSDAVIAIRQSKLPDPRKIPNAGSFFKNPLIEKNHLERLRQRYPEMPYFELPGQFKIPAAWLIEQCGWKGKRVGNVGVHDRQALVLVNHGGGHGREVIDLAEQIRCDVQTSFDIQLEREVNVIPIGYK